MAEPVKVLDLWGQLRRVSAIRGATILAPPNDCDEETYRRWRELPEVVLFRSAPVHVRMLYALAVELDDEAATFTGEKVCALCGGRGERIVALSQVPGLVNFVDPDFVADCRRMGSPPIEKSEPHRYTAIRADGSSVEYMARTWLAEQPCPCRESLAHERRPETVSLAWLVLRLWQVSSRPSARVLGYIGIVCPIDGWPDAWQVNLDLMFSDTSMRGRWWVAFAQWVAERSEEYSRIDTRALAELLIERVPFGRRLATATFVRDLEVNPLGNRLWRIEQRGEQDHFVVTSWRVDITNHQACTWSLPSDASGRTSSRGRPQGRIPEHHGRVPAHDHEASIAVYMRSLNRSLRVAAKTRAVSAGTPWAKHDALDRLQDAGRYTPLVDGRVTATEHPEAEADRLHRHRMGWAHEQERRQTYGEFVTDFGRGPDGTTTVTFRMKPDGTREVLDVVHTDPPYSMTIDDLGSKGPRPDGIDDRVDAILRARSVASLREHYGEFAPPIDPDTPDVRPDRVWRDAVLERMRQARRRGPF